MISGLSLPRPLIPLLHSVYISSKRSAVSLTLCCFVATRRFVLSFAWCYFVFVFFSHLSIAITWLGEERELIFVLFVRLFNLCLIGFVCFLFLLVSGKGCGLWLWHFLDFCLSLICTANSKNLDQTCRDNFLSLRKNIKHKIKVSCHNYLEGPFGFNDESSVTTQSYFPFWKAVSKTSQARLLSNRDLN